jgi:hypothetical protein
MAERDRALIIDSLGNCFNSSTRAAGVTASCSVSPAATERAHLTAIGWSLKNLTAANATAVLQVTDASIGGTVLAQWEIIVPTGNSLQDSFSTNLQGLRGSPINVAFNTVQASLGQAVSISGYHDTLGG